MQRSEQTHVRAATDAVVVRLPRRLAVDGVDLELTRGWAPGDAAGSRRTTATWRRGRAAGTATIEVRPAGWGWSELELRWVGTGPYAGLRARSRGDASTLVRTLGARVDGRVLGAAPTSASRMPRGRTLVATATSIAVIGASVVIGPLTASTPVTADDAVAQFRATAQAADATTSSALDVADVGPDPARPDPDGTLEVDAGSAPSAPAPDVGTPVAAGAAPSAAPRAPAAGAADERTDAAEAPSRPAPAGTDRTEPSPARPPAGVYRYATDGFEELDTRGGHRRFPEETVQVVHHTDCGFRQVWEPLAERRDEHGFCSDVAPPLLVTTDTARSFFGQQRRQRFACTPVRTDRDGWTARCDDTDGTTMMVTTRREGTERRSVGGQSVEVSRMRVDAELTGETTGRRRSTVWVRASDGLLVRSEVEAELEVPGPFGRMGYRERYVLDLADLEPRT